MPFPRGRPPKIVYPEARARRCRPLSARCRDDTRRRRPGCRRHAIPWLNPNACTHARRAAASCAPQDKLIGDYYRRNPAARFLPIECAAAAVAQQPRCSARALIRAAFARSLPCRLNSSVPHFAQRFAWRQLALMQAEGLCETAARERVSAEVAAAQKRMAEGATGAPGPDDWLAPPPAPRRVMAAVQAEEEAVLRRVHGSAAPAGGAGRRRIT
jgi:hypothetical protein